MFLSIRSLRMIHSLLAFSLLSATLGLAQTSEDSDKKEENPLLRARFRLQTLKSGKGEYNPEDLLKAKRHVKAMTFSPSVWPSSQPMAAGSGAIQPLTAGIQPANWVSMGPGNAGGRIRSILVHPTNPDILYLGSVTGGVWKSLNRGASWTPLNDFMANLVISCMAMDPKNPSILYAGTGEYYAGGGFRGAGIFKSTDAGLTWNQLAQTATPAFHFVNRLAISPLNSQVLLAATASGLYRSIDGGATWSQRVNAIIADVHFHPTDGTKAIAGGYSAAWSSADAGVTWLPANIPAMVDSDRRWETAYAPSAPGTVYASVDNNNGEFYVSFDGGRSYNVRNWGNSLLNQGWYDNTLWVDPADANKLLLGGTNLWISSNAGQTFTIASYGIHGDQHAIVAGQGFPSPRTLYVGNDGGICRIDDYFTLLSAPQNFTNLNNSLAITQFYGAAGNLANGRVVGGTQDNGVRWSNGSNPNAWSDQYGGDGGWTASDPVLAADGTSIWYVEEQGWNTWRLKVNSAGDFTEQFYLNNSPETHYLFIPPMIIDPNSPTRLYKGGNSLWRLDNPRTQTVDVPWTRVKPAMPTNNAISAIGVAVGNSNILWVGHEGGPVFSTANALAATPTWVQRNTSGTTLPNWNYVSEIAIDPANSNRVYVGLAGFNPDNLWKSEDGGATWMDITSNLPEVPVRAIAINKSNTNFIYAGTEIGLFASENRGATWSPTNEGPANVSVDDLFWMGNKLVAATHGRGVFSMVMNTPPTLALTAPANQATFPAGANITLTATASDPDGSVARVEFYQGTFKLGEDATSPYAYTWNGVAAGSYALTARAIDLDQGMATSAVANITVGTPPGGTVRNPVADAHVRDGTSAAVNFGTSATLETKTSTAGFNRDAYLKFDMAGIAGFTSKATLRIFAKLSEAGSVNDAAYPVANTAWTETGLTWNNRPALGAAPLSTLTLSGTTAAWYEFDVTSHVRKQRANGQAILGLGLHMVTAANPLTQANSREAATGKPELVFTQTQPKALLVVGSLTLNAGDTALRNRLQALGFTVTLKDGPTSAAADAAGMSVVVISSTISSSSVNTKFRASATPVVNCEQALQDDFALTGTLSGTDFGTTASQTQVKILNASHALAGGVTGTLAVTSATDAFNWGKPNANAFKIAAIVGDDTKVADYGYEKGVSMVGLIAPGRRVNLFPGDIAAGGFNASGWSLFDAAVLWAAGL